MPDYRATLLRAVDSQHAAAMDAAAEPVAPWAPGRGRARGAFFTILEVSP